MTEFELTWRDSRDMQHAKHFNVSTEASQTLNIRSRTFGYTCPDFFNVLRVKELLLLLLQQHATYPGNSTALPVFPRNRLMNRLMSFASWQSAIMCHHVPSCAIMCHHVPSCAIMCHHVPSCAIKESFLSFQLPEVCTAGLGLPLARTKRSYLQSIFCFVTWTCFCFRFPQKRYVGNHDKGKLCISSPNSLIGWHSRKRIPKRQNYFILPYLTILDFLNFSCPRVWWHWISSKVHGQAVGRNRYSPGPLSLSWKQVTKFPLSCFLCSLSGKHGKQIVVWPTLDFEALNTWQMVDSPPYTGRRCHKFDASAPAFNFASCFSSLGWLTCDSHDTHMSLVPKPFLFGHVKKRPMHGFTWFYDMHLSSPTNMSCMILIKLQQKHQG